MVLMTRVLMGASEMTMAIIPTKALYIHPWPSARNSVSRDSAADSGTTGARYGKLDDIAWYDRNSGNRTHSVAKTPPNVPQGHHTL